MDSAQTLLLQGFVLGLSFVPRQFGLLLGGFQFADFGSAGFALAAQLGMAGDQADDRSGT